MNVAIVTGGFSDEARISEESAKTVWNHLPEKYNKHLIKIYPDGWWYVPENDHPVPMDRNDFSVTINGNKITFDVVFLMIHGSPAEDGILQGYFNLIKMPYTTSDVLPSALTFNKASTTSFLKDYGILSPPHMVASITNFGEEQIETIASKLGMPCFVKPNGGGSSIGASKVEQKEDLGKAIKKAFKHDHYVIVEKFIEGREVTCGVINYKGQVTSLAVTEIVSPNNFFDFDAKYQNKNTREITPAPISEKLYDECLKTTEKIYKILELRGMARMDYIIKDEKLYFIEVNTIPGLTQNSLLPQQAAYQNISLPELLENSIQQALGMF